MLNQFKSSPILYAQGSTLAEGVGVPVPRTAFGLNKGLKTEFFATPDWTGRPVATDDRARCPGRLGKCQARARSRNRQLLRPLERAPSPHPRRSLRLHGRTGDSFPYSPTECYRLILDGKVLGEGILRQQSTSRRWATSRPRRAPRPPRRR